jgi:hypothetical protein
MNKKEIELHYLPCSICGINVLSFHHSIKSTRRLQAIVTQKWWLVCVGVVLGIARDGRPPPVVASSTGSWCSSRDGALGWCQPLGGVRARCSHGAVRFKVLHTLSEEVGTSLLLSTLLHPAKVRP